MDNCGDGRASAARRHPDVVVVYLLRRSERGELVLLGEKLRGLGAGNVVAPGGKREPGESARAAARREVLEEVGLSVEETALEHRGRLDYRFPHRPEWDQRSDVFLCRQWTGTVAPSVELEATWTPIDAVPYDRMWDDAGLWLPAVLAGGTVHGRVVFGSDNRTVAEANGEGLIAPPSGSGASSSPK